MIIFLRRGIKKQIKQAQKLPIRTKIRCLYIVIGSLTFKWPLILFDILCELLNKIKD